MREYGDLQGGEHSLRSRPRISYGDFSFPSPQKNFPDRRAPNGAFPAGIPSCRENCLVYSLCILDLT